MTLAREGWPFVAAPALALVATAWWAGPGWASLLVPPLVFAAWFFRDPTRRTPADPHALFSPADGRIIMAGPRRISVFMNVFNVHVCRSPRAGKVRSVQHHAGRFRAAFRDDASECNERVVVELNDGADACRFVLVAGLVARRIVCKVEPGRQLAAGERVGLIRFGSRVDVDLPAGMTVAVEIGQKVVAGETPIARLATCDPGLA